ncbi:hypothetical protein KSB_90040 [Ktedonobacter robiniae]|uniref:Uncharacterized protein n=1 Tax=Ktedonobacter robiniae TaxID=2778365 RepID=A0ABQ3V6D7_9CHLR|nr:hypothetical protein KSB_90040 [Ktedonobacter robiniae]
MATYLSYVAQFFEKEKKDNFREKGGNRSVQARSLDQKSFQQFSKREENVGKAWQDAHKVPSHRQMRKNVLC